MEKDLRIFYIINLLFSTLLYAIPYRFGRIFLRGGLIIIIAISLMIIFRIIWEQNEKEQRFSVTILLVNGIAVLHFLLIFLKIVFNPSGIWLLITGLAIAGLTYYIVNRQLI